MLSVSEIFLGCITAHQNGFEYKVKTQANDYQNLKVDTLRVQNNRKLKSYTVEFFSGKFLTAPTVLLLLLLLVLVLVLLLVPAPAPPPLPFCPSLFFLRGRYL